MDKSHNGRANTKEVDEGVHDLAHVLKHRLLVVGGGGEEHDEVEEGEEEHHAARHCAHGGVGPVGLGQGSTQVGSPGLTGGQCSHGATTGTGDDLVPGQSVHIIPGVVEQSAPHQRELNNEAEEEGATGFENLHHKVSIMILLCTLLGIKVLNGVGHKGSFEYAMVLVFIEVFQSVLIADIMIIKVMVRGNICLGGFLSLMIGMQ